MTALEKLRWISSQVRLSDPSGFCANLLDEWMRTQVIEISHTTVLDHDRSSDRPFGGDSSLIAVVNAVVSNCCRKIEEPISVTMGGGVVIKRSVIMVIERE